MAGAFADTFSPEAHNSSAMGWLLSPYMKGIYSKGGNGDKVIDALGDRS